MHEALRATVWALHARLGGVGLGGLGVAGESVHLGSHLDGFGNQRLGEHRHSGVFSNTIFRSVLEAEP
jgi:hypothetical protein